MKVGIIGSAAVGQALAKAFKSEGYDEIKITFMVTRKSYDAIMRSAKEVGIKVTGHVGPRGRIEYLTDVLLILERDNAKRI